MKLSEFDYTLPKELIAQYPSERRGDDRLLVIDRAGNNFMEKKFPDITGYPGKGDLLILNDTRVMQARLFGKRKTGGRIEIFVVDKTKNPTEALVRPSGRIREGEKVLLDSGDSARILGKAGIGRLVEFDKPTDEILDKCGHVPLPPYIARADEPSDADRYQTVYASKEGATASPTAGLHFTMEVIEDLKKNGVKVGYITLHVSYGTFAPVKEENVEDHKMHAEFYNIPPETASMIEHALGKGAKIYACGTTSLRTLEACADRLKEPGNAACGMSGFTDIFIYPGYDFKITDALITNFHLPKSTLFLLTSAFAGRDLLGRAYRYAVDSRFRFFSYGDVMLIL
ncbi:MAG: tRNA preQ1(34) S-adenosylmethionine ribosyltransferase-isomerase QueA [Candidatus Omnitrophica bacterium]|nr:tRNA preQ1(34) S-adenosylmethionine ribosyltransferase-isomerase QueA [Candidatus Omnitrophota bacterium]